MTQTEMEEALEKLTVQVSSITQILPTLATKADLEWFATKADLERFATKADLERFATKADLERFATKADLERFATKEDLEQYATKAELRDEIADAKRHTDILVESVRDDIRLVAEGVASIITKVDSLAARIDLRGRGRDS